MLNLTDFKNREVRYTEERKRHSENNHPEMKGQLGKIRETLLFPDYVVESKIDNQVELFYKYYKSTPVRSKYLCITVKCKVSDSFILTAYFTDTIKKGKLLWERK